MSENQHESIFLKYAEIFSLNTSSKYLAAPLKDHPQIPMLIDILIRKEHHHILLTSTQSEKINLAFLQSFSQQLTSDHTPKLLREAYLIYFDVNRLALQNESIDFLTRDFALLAKDLAETGKEIIFVINQIDPLLTLDITTPIGFLGQWMKKNLLQSQWRFIVLNHSGSIAIPSYFESYFSTLTLSEPTESELLALLSAHRESLENFHHVIIPDDILSSALALSSHYLAGKHRLEKTFELLDSSAARTAAEKSDGLTKPVVTHSILSTIVSNWTEIPVNYLHHNKFKSSKLTQAIQRRVFGQDNAINSIASVLQHTCLKLNKKPGPMCSFIFAGPNETGKTECVEALTEHLFGNTQALLRITPTQVNSLEDVIVTQQHQSISLFAAITKTPYAIILIENIDTSSTAFINLFKSILLEGHAINRAGQKISFQHSIFIITTNLGTESIRALAPTTAGQDATHSLDLMQLVLNETPTQKSSPQASNGDITDEIIAALENYFAPEMIRVMNVISFMMLDHATVEKIIRLKLSALGKRLQIRYSVELSYAPEVLRFLVHEVLWRKSNKTIDQILEHHLYSRVAHEILSHIDDKNKPKQLILQLSANGQMLRCESTSTEHGTFYKVT